MSRKALQVMTKRRSVRLLCLGVAFFAARFSAPSQAAEKPAAAVTATLNGLSVVLDERTGSILSLTSPGAGEMLRTTPDCASILDLAYPLPQFEPLRLASRFSAGAQITKAAEGLTIHWDRLGASRTAFPVAGGVAATVTLHAAADKKSVIMACRIENRSDNAIRQVLFPDFLGLIPFGGPAETEFRSGEGAGAVVNKPFQALVKPERDQFYAGNSTFIEFTSGGKDSQSVGRWMLLGTAKAGFAFFPRRTVWDQGPIVMLHYWEKNDRLRMMCCHYVNLGKGATWESCEYCLTPYRQGLAEAVAPYRAWLKEQAKGAKP
jgi:hypothetical protein